MRTRRQTAIGKPADARSSEGKYSCGTDKKRDVEGITSLDEIRVQREERKHEHRDWHRHRHHGGGRPDMGLMADV
jgi:hypothetical protein